MPRGRDALVSPVGHFRDLHPDFCLNHAAAGVRSGRPGHHDDVYRRRFLLRSFVDLIDVTVEDAVVARGRAQRDDNAEKVSLVAFKTLERFTQ